MYETLAELLTEFGSGAVRAVGAVCATVAGIFVEMNGIRTLGTGEQLIGVWMAFFGILLLVVGYVLARDALERLRQPAT